MLRSMVTVAMLAAGLVTLSARPAAASPSSGSCVVKWALTSTLATAEPQGCGSGPWQVTSYKEVDGQPPAIIQREWAPHASVVILPCDTKVVFALLHPNKWVSQMTITWPCAR